MRLKDDVRQYWELNPCGTSSNIVGALPPASREWFEQIEEYRYGVEPFIHSVAQFTRHRGKRMLEIGIGVGTDFLQWARAGTRCVGIDLTKAAVQITKTRLECYGFTARVACADAEALPFGDETFDLVYSWGVLHHSQDPRLALREIWRILRPGGTFIGMMYSRHSLVALRLWVRHALMKGRPWRSFADVIWHQMESIGTKAYTVPELRRLFQNFAKFNAHAILTPYDTGRWPRWIASLFPDSLGWFITLTASR